VAAELVDEAGADETSGSAAPERSTTVVLVMAIESTTSDWPVRAFLYCGKSHRPGMSVNFQPWLSMLG
jgi:hypothetical protein